MYKMSRYAKDLKENRKIVYGWDHALGYFYEIWENYNSKESQCLVDKCSAFGMKKNDFVKALEDAEVEKSHRLAVVLDLTF
jgi:hypothetical protein